MDLRAPGILVASTAALVGCFGLDLAPGKLECDRTASPACPAGFVCRSRGDEAYCYPPGFELSDAGLPASPSRIEVGGRQWFLAGINLPWLTRGHDFGGGDIGVASTEKRPTLEKALRDAGNANARVVRWVMFGGNPLQFHRDGSLLTLPTAVSSEVKVDLDAALGLAAAHNLYLILILFDNADELPAEWCSDPAHRDALATVLQRDLLTHYARSERILGWEVFRRASPDSDRRALVKQIAAAVHASTSALVTTNADRLSAIGDWTGLDLDYHSVGWRPGDFQGADDVLRRPAAEAATAEGVAVPIVVSTIVAGNGETAAGQLKAIYDNGYAGVLPWSALAEAVDDGYQGQVDLDVLGAFTGARSDVGPR